MTTTVETKPLFIKMAITNWEVQVKRAGKLLDSLTDEQLMKEIAPGRNRGIYLIGHLIAIHDALLPLFGLGELLYPGLEVHFTSNADNPEALYPSIPELREYWQRVHLTLADHFNALTADQWFERHAAVSAEDFAKEPHRNKLNVLLGRTGHLTYHLGQLVLLK